jgi:hypothetical protein
VALVEEEWKEKDGWAREGRPDSHGRVALVKGERKEKDGWAFTKGV